MEIIIFILCCYLNYNRAKQAELNGAKWVLFTFIAMFIAVMIGSVALFLSFTTEDPELKQMILARPQNQQLIMASMQKKLKFLHELFVLFCGLGGYLAVRYWLTKQIEKSNKNDTSYS